MRITKDAKKFIAKILVAVLIISMMPSFGVEVKADGPYDWDDSTLTVRGSSTVVKIYSDHIHVYNDTPGETVLDEDVPIALGSGSNLTVTGASTVELMTDMTLTQVTIAEGCSLSVSSGKSLTASKINNAGQCELDSLSVTPTNIQASSGTVWKVASSFSASGFNSELIGTVEANEDTFINSDGGTFTLKVGSATREISGSANGYAGELVNETVDPSGLSLTAAGVNFFDGTYYAKGNVTISAPAGYYWYYNNEYQESFNFTEGDLIDSPTPRPINSSFKFQNASTGKTTPNLLVSDYLNPSGFMFYDSDFHMYRANIIFDPDAPGIEDITADGESIDYVSNMTINASTVVVWIGDEYLDTNKTVVSSGATFEEVDGIEYERDVKVTFNAVSGVDQNCTVTAYDYAGNPKTFSFILSGGFISSDGLKCTLSGLVNEKYTKDKVTVKAPDGYEIMPSYGTGDKYVESFDYKRSDLYGSDGKFKSDLTFTFKRKSDGAVTKPVAWDKCCDFLDDVIFDEIDPAISTVTADNKTITFKTGDVIEAASVTFTVTDVNLEKIVVDKTVTDRTNGVKKDGNLYKGTVTFTVAEGESKSYKFTAYDMSGRTVEYTFTLKYPRQVPDLTVTLADQFAGVSYTPAITTVSDGAKDVKYYYAENIKASVSANEFSETVPTMPGKYVVKAVIPETNKYLSATAYAEFSIAYLPTPENPYTLDGDMGENGYYKTDVLITPPTGYTICATLTGTYTKTLTYSAAIKDIYLKQTSTGALTGPVAFNETLKVDTIAPAISTAAKNQAGNVVDLSKLIYADKVTFTISDEHLSKVTINGQEVSFTDGRVTISLVCNGHKYFNIVAVDEAGNEYSFRVEMKATWLQSGIVPVGTLISLVPGEGVALEPGEFIIEDSDDTTVYNGGMEVYVSEETELTLIKVN